MDATQLHQAMPDGIVRGLAIVGLAGIALIHLFDAPGRFEEAPYLGWMSVTLILGCFMTAGSLVRGNQRHAWLAAGALALSAMVGYTLSRTTGLPGASVDIGNWSEQLGIASLFVDGTVVAVSAFALRDRVPKARLRAVATEVAR